MTATETQALPKKGDAIGVTPQFVVNRNDLVRELTLAVGAVEKRTTIPILANVKLEARAADLVITATDLEISLLCGCDAAVTKPGVITLPAKRLLDYIRLLPDGDVSVKVTDNQWATITAGKSKSRIAGMGADSFPDLPTPGETICSASLKTVARMIGQVNYAISMEESRFTLVAALLEMTGGNLRLIATDGHRLAMSKSTGADCGGSKLLIQRKALLELVKLAGASPLDATVQFSTDDNHVFFTVGARILTARRMSGNFPDYARILPSSFKGTASVDQLQLRSALNRVRGFADERSRSVKVAIADSQVTIFAASLETGDSEESVTAEVAGAMTTGFNADYLLDFLGATEAERVLISFGDDKTAIQLAPVGAEDCLCIVMPMRI